MVLRRLAKDSAVYGGADLATKVLSFFLFPLIAAALSPKAFGALELIGTTTSLLSLVVNCGLNNAVQRFYWDIETTPEMQPVIVTSGLYAQLVFGTLAVIAGLVAVPFVLPWMRSEEWPLTWVALVAALLVMALTQWSQYVLDVVRLHFAPWRFFTLALTSRVISMAFGLVAVVTLGLGIDGLMTAEAVMLVLVMPLALWMIRRDFRPRSFDFSWFKKLVNFGYPFIYSGLAYWLFASMDRWLLASMSSVEEVGIFSVAFRFASVVWFVSTAFGQAWSPAAMKIRADHPDQYRSIYGQILLLLLFVMLVVGGSVALFSGEIISLIMPDEYLASALPLAILCFGVVLQATQQVTALGLSLEKKTHLLARLAWLTAAVNFVGNLILIPRFGAAGASCATVLSYFVLTGCYLYYTQRLHPIAVQWGRLAVLLALGSLVALVSILFVAETFDPIVFLAKLALAIVCLLIGWLVLPVHSFKVFK
jgi:O-antigen/teichoic acid export membrane protein